METHERPDWAEAILRLVTTGDNNAFRNLLSALNRTMTSGNGGSNEAHAWVRIIQEYVGPRVAAPETYKYARLAARTDQGRKLIDLFECHDHIASSPEDFPMETAQRGLNLARELGAPEVEAKFHMLIAQVHVGKGMFGKARKAAEEAMSLVVPHLLDNAEYHSMLSKLLQNYVSFSYGDGQFDKARSVLRQFGHLIVPEARQTIAAQIGPPPRFPDDVDEISRMGSDALSEGHTARAVEWLQEAVRRNLERGREDACCGDLGDLAVAFNRLGNVERATELNQEAISLCRRYEDWTNLSRWSQNLANIHLERKDNAAARPLLEEAVRAAKKSGDPTQISSAQGNLGVLYINSHRYQEAAECFERALEATTKPHLHEIFLNNLLASLDRWAETLREENQLERAVEVQTRAAEESPLTSREEKSQAGIRWAKVAALYDQLSRLDTSKAYRDRATALFREAGDESGVQMMARIEEAGANRFRVVMFDRDEDLETFRQQAEAAVAESGYVEKELEARTQLAYRLLGEDSDEAVKVFEEALQRARTTDFTRIELSLSLNFTPFFLDRGETGRAFRLAERANALAAESGDVMKAVAALHLGDVWDRGHGELHRAFEYLREGVELLGKLRRASPEVAERIVEGKGGLLGRAGQIALELGDVDAAVDMIAMWDPDRAEQLRRMRPNSRRTI